MDLSLHSSAAIIFLMATVKASFRVGCWILDITAEAALPPASHTRSSVIEHASGCMVASPM